MSYNIFVFLSLFVFIFCDTEEKKKDCYASCAVLFLCIFYLFVIRMPYDIFVFLSVFFLSFCDTEEEKKIFMDLVLDNIFVFLSLFKFYLFVILRQRKTFSDEQPFFGGFLGKVYLITKSVVSNKLQLVQF